MEPSSPTLVSRGDEDRCDDGSGGNKAAFDDAEKEEEEEGAAAKEKEAAAAAAAHSFDAADCRSSALTPLQTR